MMWAITYDTNMYKILILKHKKIKNCSIFIAYPKGSYPTPLEIASSFWEKITSRTNERLLMSPHSSQSNTHCSLPSSISRKEEFFGQIE